MGSIPGYSSLSDETLNRGPMTIFQDNLLTRTYCGEAGDYVVPNVLSPRDLVFRPDISDINCTIIMDFNAIHSTLCSVQSRSHQDNMSVCFIPPYTLLLYRKTGVYRGIHYFLIFALKHILWVLVRTASLRRF